MQNRGKRDRFSDMSVRFGRRRGGARPRTGGFTLTEIAIVLGVVGAITAAIWVAADSTHESQKDNDALTELQTVAQNIDTMMTGRTFGASGNITGNMIAAQAIPNSYVETATTAGTPWSGGGLYVWAQTAGSGVFRVAFYGVTMPGCLALLLKGTACQPGQSECPFQVGTGGNVTTPGTSVCVPDATCPGGTAAPNLGWRVMGVASATALCGANSYSGGSNSVEFYYAP